MTRHELRDFGRTFHGNPSLQIRYVGNLVMTHAALTDEVMDIEGTNGARLTPEEKQETAQAVVRVISSFDKLYPDWRAIDPSYTRIVDDIIEGRL